MAQNAIRVYLFFVGETFLPTLSLLTCICLWWGRRSKEEDEVRGKETIIPPSEMDKLLLSTCSIPPPFFLLQVGAHNWSFVQCVNSLPVYTFPDCVQPPNRWGLYVEDTHTCLHKSIHTGLDAHP